MQRTIIVQLEPSPAHARILDETTRLFTEVFNHVCAYGWDHREKNGVELHRALYYPLKESYPELVSDLHVQARVKATAAVKSALALQKLGRKVRPPRSVSCPPRYNQNSYTVDWESRTVRLSTTLTYGRQTIRFAVPAYAEKYAGCAADTADLVRKDGRWCLHIVVTVPAPDVQPTDDVMGVDLGLSQPAVTSNRQFLGEKRWKDREGKLFKLKRALQQKGSRSAKRHLKKLRRKQARFRRDCDHVLSKQIVQSVDPGSTIVLENLTNIRKRTKIKKKTETRRRIHAWSFAHLKGFIAYKAEERGCTVDVVDPRHTSQTCRCCGHQARTNRRSRAVFKCRACGYELHADLNASYNIAAKYRAQSGRSGLGGLPVNQPLVSNPTLRRSG